jgi:hypothetical protein
VGQFRGKVRDHCSDLRLRLRLLADQLLTVRDVQALTERKKAELLRSWKPIEWRVDHVQLISRTATDPFEVINTVPLGSAPARTPARTQQNQQQRPQQQVQQQQQQQQQQQIQQQPVIRQPRQPRAVRRLPPPCNWS